MDKKELKLHTQEGLEELFRHSSLIADSGAIAYFGSAISIDSDEGDYPYVYIGECEYMGALMSVDCEDGGYDALFFETVVAMFAAGTLRVVPEGEFPAVSP